jgi:hypothetical protein
MRARITNRRRALNGSSRARNTDVRAPRLRCLERRWSGSVLSMSMAYSIIVTSIFEAALCTSQVADLLIVATLSRVLLLIQRIVISIKNSKRLGAICFISRSAASLLACATRQDLL